MNTFEILNSIDVSGKTEGRPVKDRYGKTHELTYLSWAWAWGEFKKLFPDSFYTIYENKDGLNYHNDGRTCWVKTGVTLVDGDKQNEAIEYLPIMDFKNTSIPLEKVTSFEVNKTIQRSLTKAIARHGLGLYIYAGEDLPECDDTEQVKQQKTAQKAKSTQKDGSYTITDKQVKLIYTKASECGLTNEQVHKGCKKYFDIDSVKELSKAQMDTLLGMFENAKKAEVINNE